MAVHKKIKEIKTEPVVVSDVVTETIEVIEQVTPQAAKSGKPAESMPAADPLTDFKEKMNEEESLPSDMPPKKNFMWPILFIFILAILVLVGVFLYKQGINTNDKVNVVTLSPTPTIIPEPTKTIDLTQHEIEILNGSGISGEASRQKESLEAEGFTVSSIGNADNSDYTDTIIQAKKEVEKAFLDKLKNVLKESFVVGEMEELPEDADSDIIIIIGSEMN